MVLLRNIDLVLLAIALPVFVLAGFPLIGWAGAAAAWVAQRALNAWTTRKAQQSDDIRTTVGILTGSMIGRGWLVALTIFGVGLADNAAGLAAAVLAVILFTAYFTANMIFRPFDTHQPST
jgi:hypothetical protein